MRYARYLALLLILPFGLLLGRPDTPNMIDAEEGILSDQSIPVPPVASDGPCTFDMTLEVVALHDVFATVTASCPSTIEATYIVLYMNDEVCTEELNNNSNYAKTDCGNELGPDEYCAYGAVFYDGGVDFSSALCGDI